MMRRFNWRATEFVLIVRGMALFFFAYLILFAKALYAQSTTPAAQNPPTMGAMFYTQTTADPWFWAVIAYMIFSAIVSGMPEPEKTDSKGYVWLYRSAHLLAQMGTSYFQHRDLWPNKPAEESTK